MDIPIIGLTGHAGAGKDTIATLLAEKYGYVRYGFADSVRDLLLRVDPVIVHERVGRLSNLVEEFGWDYAKREVPEVRRLLVQLGVGVRNAVGADAWIRALERRMREDYEIGRPIVISDVRFPNEFTWIQDELGGWLWLVEREGNEALDNEAEQFVEDAVPDLVLHNNGTVEDLDDVLNRYMGED